MTAMTRHPKGVPTGGQFAPGAHTESAIALPAPAAESPSASSWQLCRTTIERETGGAPAINKYPTRKSDAKRLLRNSRGETDGGIRMVHLNHTNAPDSDNANPVDVVGPKDGRPIVVMVGSGIPRLKVTSGKAIINADSGWGNVVDVADGAEAIIVSDSQSKVTATIEPGGTATFVSNSEQNRLRPFVYDGGHLDLVVGVNGEKKAYVPEPVDPNFYAPIQ